MAHYFFDTSALIKHYHPELGSARVDALLGLPGARIDVSRLAVVEFYSALAKKVRAGPLARPEFRTLTRRFRADVRAKTWRIVRLTVAHFDSSSDLIRRIGTTQNLRTLDALQLVVALSLNDPVQPIEFVCADQALCNIAKVEGLSVINPERP